MAQTALVRAVPWAMFCCLAATAGAAGTWYIDVVDRVGFGVDEARTSLALDASGHPHVVYYEWSSGDLRYAGWMGSYWDIQLVEAAGDVGQYASLALDSSGRPHVSYYDATSTKRDLKYARSNGTSWDVQTLHSPTWAHTCNSLALDASGYPRMAYYDWTDRDLKYAAWNGSTWVIQTVESAGDVGDPCSLALDSLGRPCISYYDYFPNGTLKYAAWTGSSWLIQTVDAVADVGNFNSLALDTAGSPHISYYDSDNGDLKYAAWTGSTWLIQQVDTGGDVGMYTSLALDASGAPRISYHDWDNGHLKYAAWTGSGWLIQQVDTGGRRVGMYTCLALDAGGSPRISYYDYDSGDLRYAAWNGSTWSIETVDNVGDVRWYTSLALDAEGHPHISYHRSLSAMEVQLKYATWTGSNWVIETLNSTGDVGTQGSLALDSLDRPRISYYDLRSGKLKYAAWSGSTWVIDRVDDLHDVGTYTSLALDASGSPHVSYYDESSHALRYAAWNGAAWDVHRVHLNLHAGPYTSLAVDPSGYPCISYYGSGDLQYATWNGTTWDLQTVDSAGLVGRGTSLALAATGYPRISYYDYSNGNLKYAAWTGATWVTETVDSADAVGSWNSLALDSSGYPHISYYDWTNRDLKYAAWNGTAWAIETVDSGGRVGSHTSVAVDADGFAHITYHDATNGTLKYATNRLPPQATHELAATGYYMISLPVTPSSLTVHDVLCDDLGCGNYYMWGWQGGGYQTIPTSPPGCQSTALSMQEGYWILAAASTIGMRGTQAITDQAIPLQAGWNMVAVPHESIMDDLQVDDGSEVKSLADAQADNWVLATFYGSHDGTGSYSTLTIDQSPADKLSLWCGYWVLAGLDCSLIVPLSPPAPPTATTAAVRGTSRPAWAFGIQATSGSSSDSITIAAADGASDGFDGFALDKPKPPASPGEHRLRTVLTPDAPFVGRGCPSPPAFATSSPLPTCELAMETKGATQEETEWHFTVTGGVKGEHVTLRWPELSRLPKDRVGILTDCDSGKRTFMRSRAQYEFAAPGEGSSRSFTVTVKSAQQAGLLIISFSVVPLRGGRGAEIAFGLSADAAVDIRIVNIAGRPVGVVRDGLAIEAGAHTVAWDGRSMTDTPLPNGLYLCVLKARAPDGQQARRVCPVALSR